VAFVAAAVLAATCCMQAFLSVKKQVEKATCTGKRILETVQEAVQENYGL
jgi:hypothetical protein